jgi:hypothetical protein
MHGSPEGGALVYRIYGGKDLFPFLQSIGFEAGYVEQGYPEYGIGYQNIIICRKPEI